MPKKQRHTAKRIWQVLQNEGFTGGYTIVKDAVHILDISPTLLDIAGYDVPDSMIGRSWISGVSNTSEELSEDQEAIVRERLRGLGYI